MMTTNRLASFYAKEKMVPFDEVEMLRADSWNEGYQTGFDHGVSSWWLGVSGGLILGFLFALCLR